MNIPRHPWDDGDGPGPAVGVPVGPFAAHGVPRHSWEEEEGDGDLGPAGLVEELDSDDDDSTMSADQAGKRFMEMLTMLYMGSEIPARRFCLLSYYSYKAGVYAAKRYAMRPSKHSGSYQRHLDPIFNFKGFDKTLYDLPVATTAKDTIVRDVRNVPVVPPHEFLSRLDDIDRARRLKEAIDSDGLPPLYFTNPSVTSAPVGEPGFPTALYIDGVPYSDTDSVVGFWIVDVLTEARCLVATLRKRHFCACGCKGWCSLYFLFVWLAWSLTAAVIGLLPSSRHDGTAWRLPGDAERAATSGTRMARHCPLWIKVDWLECCVTLGFPTWQDSKRLCFSLLS